MPDDLLQPTAMAAGGDAIARDADGRVVFVEGALPGERVRVAVTDERRDFARARVVEVVDASPDRIAPPCPNVALGCGGCAWQHVAPAAQLGLKAEIVADSLRRLGRVEAPPARSIGLASTAQRTTLRMGVIDGRAGFHRRQASDLVVVDDCAVAHPLLAELLSVGRFGDAAEVVLRAGARTGERLVMTSPTRADVDVPVDVVVVGEDEVRAGAPAAVHEVVAGRRWRISALAFAQSGPEAAEALAGAVRDAALAFAPEARSVVDLYAGGGLLGGVVAEATGATSLVAVESNRWAVADARVNLADLPARVVRAEVGRYRNERPAELVIADPARTGLGKPGVATVGRIGAPALVLVSCDPASLGRDTRLLADTGYRLRTLTVVDCFPGTAHVEVVAGYTTHSD